MHAHRLALMALVLGALAAPAMARDCIITSKSTVDLGANATGVVAQIHVDRSDAVRAGQVLAEFEASEERARIARAELVVQDDTDLRLATVRAASAKLKADRLRLLDDRGLTVADDLEEAELAYEVARIEAEKARFDNALAQEELKAAQAALERKRIRAPFDAVVTERFMSPGEVYTEQTPILRLAELDTLYVESYFPTSERSKLTPGDRLTVTLEDGRTRQATLDVIDPVLDAATGTFGLRLTLPNPDGSILAGARCTLNPAGQ